MRKIEFEVPQEAMTEFADAIANSNLSNTVTGTTQEGDVIIEVEYDKDENDEVEELESILEKILADGEEKEDQEEDQD